MGDTYRLKHGEGEEYARRTRHELERLLRKAQVGRQRRAIIFDQVATAISPRTALFAARRVPRLEDRVAAGLVQRVGLMVRAKAARLAVWRHQDQWERTCAMAEYREQLTQALCCELRRHALNWFLLGGGIAAGVGMAYFGIRTWKRHHPSKQEDSNG